MADVNKLRIWIDSYGVAVRAGVVTPCSTDEAYIRKMFGLPEMPEEVIANWDKDPIRQPITLVSDEAASPFGRPSKAPQPAGGSNDEGEDEDDEGEVEDEEGDDQEDDEQPEREAYELTRELSDENPRLEQSEFKRFDYGFASDIKSGWPKIWKAGGNIYGNEAFEFWTKYKNGDRSDGVLAWVKKREAWAARHYRDGQQFNSGAEPNLSSIAGVVAQIKWGVVGVLGMSKMKSVIRQVKDKLQE